MKWIGLTGGIASGKSSVARILTQRGVPVIFADRVAHDVIKAGTHGFQQVIQRFGKRVLGGEQIDRAKLAQIVFSEGSEQARRDLENIIHPLVRIEVQSLRDMLSKQGFQIAFYEVPLLFEKKMEESFDLIVSVVIPQEEQIQRLILRSGLSASEAQQRIKAQVSNQVKVESSDFIIWNTGTETELESKVDSLLYQLQPKPNLP